MVLIRRIRGRESTIICPPLNLLMNWIRFLAMLVREKADECHDVIVAASGKPEAISLSGCAVCVCDD
ncbi:protein of unknown function [Xenorhabdus poinarii G6]|uniref:Uncharacterized protein n=1 Tax=Xenorhabdus poinarii G6 TaxID=1354304 RepID=A0A068QYQ0_9GAMM|nr:protein of unknown function [Xenorhabdus poinarii G6]